MAELREVIVTCNPHEDSVPRVRVVLEQNGFQVNQILEGLGVITGSWAHSIDELASVDGVVAVEVSQQRYESNQSPSEHTSSIRLTGRCYCGSCTWQSVGQPNWVCHCHCESCRRHCAAPFTSFFGVDNGCWLWTGNEPQARQSSAGVTRYFCAECGTHMAYHNVKWDHEMHFYLACMDDPDQLQPQFHVHWQEKLSWLPVVDDLPKYAGSADDAPAAY